MQSRIAGVRGQVATTRSKPIVGDRRERETSFVQRVGALAAAMVISVVLAGCNSGSATPPANRHIVTDARVCKTFNVAASPTMHFNSVYTGLAKVASEAKNADLRREGEILQTELRHHSFPGSAAAMNAYSQIGAVCVSHGLTAKDWPDLS